MKLEMLRCFVCVARHGSLAGAARVLGRTPSAISMMLSQLEAQIGAPLFETDRKNRLTPLGRMTLQEAERAVQVFERSVAAIQRLSRSTAGTVRIAAVPSAALTVLPAAIALFRRERPDVRLEISDVDSAAVLRRLDQDTADIGLASDGAPTVLDGEVIARDPLGIVCHRDSLIARQVGPVRWQALGLEPFIGNALCGLVTQPEVQTVFGNCALTALNTTTLMAFVRNGLGATILPERSLHDHDGPLRFILPEDTVYVRDLVLLHNPARRLSPAGEAMQAALRSAVAAPR